MNFLNQLTFTHLFRYMDYCIFLYIYFFYNTLLALFGIFASIKDCFSVLPFGNYSSSVPGGTDEIAKSIMGVDIDLVKFSDTVISKIINYLIYVF